MKGTALAYSVYPRPYLRQRCDTDLLVAADQRGAAEDVLATSGYVGAPSPARRLASHQRAWTREDALGLVHVIDLHWEVSNRRAFAQFATFAELRAAATPLPALDGALGLGPVHALLLAVSHPVMHPRGEQRLLWLYDVDLLARRLGGEQWSETHRLAAARGLGAVFRRGLADAHTALGTPVGASELPALAAYEPTARFLAPGRGALFEILSDLEALPTLSAKAQLLFELAVPPAAYMLARYGLEGRWWGRPVLPGLYLWRATLGAFRRLVLG
jgi:hypothetical protein